ncbi:MAG: DUF86 domain-containing protein [Methanoregulaceae archaeon]|nr:DUF86 domain-containing protein [Methanoregulaceae archaeon]
MKIRRELVRIKLQEIRESIGLVGSFLPNTYEEFSGLGLMKDGIYKKTEYAIETVLDVCAVLNSDLKLGIPGEDEDILSHLFHGRILSRDMVQKIRGLKAFRNIVVHRYGTIDDRIAFTLLSERIGDFELFCRDIESFLTEGRVNESPG